MGSNPTLSVLDLSFCSMGEKIEKKRVGFFLYSPNDKLLLLHRRDDKPGIVSPDTWDYFGGSLEDSDLGNPDEALARELHEELGISVEKKCIRRMFENGNEVFYVIEFPKWKTRELRLDEGSGFFWVQLPKAQFIHDITSGAKQYLQRLSAVAELFRRID